MFALLLSQRVREFGEHSQLFKRLLSGCCVKILRLPTLFPHMCQCECVRGRERAEYREDHGHV